MSESDSTPPKGPGTVFGYSGFGADGAGPKPPETAPPAPAAPAPFPGTETAPPAPAASETPASWPGTEAGPQPPATPPPAFGGAAPEPAPIGYAPYGSATDGGQAGGGQAGGSQAGGGQAGGGFAYPGAPSGGQAGGGFAYPGAPGAGAPGSPYGGAGSSPYGAPGAPFGSPPGGPTAMCAVHPETPAVGLCPRCGAYMCQWCQRINDFGEVFCATCMERVGYGTPVPWDRRQELGIFQAWWQTFKESLMRPDDFFARSSHGLTTDPPLLFAMICGWLGQIGYSVIRLAMNEQAIMILVSFATVPVGVLLSIYVGGGIAHLFAKMFGGTGSYAVTCRNWGFCHSPSALGLVPGLGMLVAAFWTIVLEVYAVKHAHRITGGKAAAAVLLPLGVLVILCCGAAMVLGAAMGAAMGSRGSF
jgi:hypothetical protein